MVSDQTYQINQLVDHFFRHESGKMISVLTKIFGVENLDLAEDVVQDSIVEAMSNWQYKGIPQNPSGWLFRVARNKALNILNREKHKRRYSTEEGYLLRSEWTAEPALDYFFSEQQIQDDQLRLLFICCHPAIKTESQIALALRTLCGFSIAEIAKAFLTSDETIHKRLVRARQRIKDDRIAFEVPRGMELERRLQTVLDTIYLMFNEGYSASQGNDLVRYEICEEAMAIAGIILSSPSFMEKSSVFALQALMELNASRFKARRDGNGSILTLEEQNRHLWDYALMEKGFHNLERAARSGEISRYHILAAISAYHCSATKYTQTDWKAILGLYDDLLKLDDSPIVVLNRAIALAKVNGVVEGIAELERIAGSPGLRSYHHYYSTLGAFYMEAGDHHHAIPALEKAIDLANLSAEKAMLQKKLERCMGKKN